MQLIICVVRYEEIDDENDGKPFQAVRVFLSASKWDALNLILMRHLSDQLPCIFPLSQASKGTLLTRSPFLRYSNPSKTSANLAFIKFSLNIEQSHRIP